jgi:hypothetical protein
MDTLSDSTMTGDDLIGQLTLVIIGYESVNVNIYRICLDAGGSNAGAVNSLRHKKRVPAVGWLPEDCVQFKNPADPSRWVYLFHCSVHNHKNGQNTLHRSHPGGTRRLMKDGTGIGWSAVVRVHENDKNINSKALQMALRYSSIYGLDKLTLMHVPEAKHPFMYNTI